MHVARYVIIIDYLLIGGYVPRQGHLGSINIYIVIFKWEQNLKKLAVRDFGKNSFEKPTRDTTSCDCY